MSGSRGMGETGAVHLGRSTERSATATIKTYDAIGRRCRERRVATGKVKRPTPRNLIWFEKLHRHGPLPSSYLHAFTAHLRRNAAWARRELTDLFHEDSVHGGPYLTRPWQQFDTMDARHHDLVYDLTDEGLAALVEEGRAYIGTPESTGPWTHRFMVACITASIELSTLGRDDVRFIPRDKITAGSLRVAVPFSEGVQTRTRDLIPDALFALGYRTGAGERFRLFALEADRGTEPGRSGRFDRKSCLRSVLQYREYVGGGLYKQHLGVNANMLVLFVTTSAARTENMIAVVAETYTGGTSFMLFQHLPQFGRFFVPPKPLPQLFSGPWRRTGYGDFSIDRV